MGKGCRVDICQHTEMGTALGVLYVGFGGLGGFPNNMGLFSETSKGEGEFRACMGSRGSLG